MVPHDDIIYDTSYCVFSLAAWHSLAPGHRAVQKLAIWIPEGS